MIRCKEKKFEVLKEQKEKEGDSRKIARGCHI